jgi:hypothetical protein
MDGTTVAARRLVSPPSGLGPLSVPREESALASRTTGRKTLERCCRRLEHAKTAARHAEPRVLGDGGRLRVTSAAASARIAPAGLSQHSCGMSSLPRRSGARSPALTVGARSAGSAMASPPPRPGISAASCSVTLAGRIAKKIDSLVSQTRYDGWAAEASPPRNHACPAVRKWRHGCGAFSRHSPKTIAAGTPQARRPSSAPAASPMSRGSSPTIRKRQLDHGANE